MLFKSLLYLSFIMFTANLFGVTNTSGSWKGKEDKCYNHNNKLLSLLNLLCNSTQNSSITVRDACYGCFFRVGVLTPGPTLLNQLSQCASLYLSNTSYAGCATQLASLVSGVRPTTSPTFPHQCYTGYCEFVRCVRRINANVLVDNCLLENIARNLSTQQDRVSFYTNITSCILARSRCNAYNPITGELQPGNKYPHGVSSQTFLANALQITASGDLRVISFSQKVGVSNLFCSAQPTLDQAGYGVTTC
ncbi:CLUMA_CG017946, isoform A [Clunio marinus]|uniref:CLUMA_CG017946, isoform A n=1 Tax=Clunio marinus TaxID=568069 RepID=A0A1J1IXL6_9DIPT|nr:CLUMA_CG017946, isoform A [Clunio marinus]